jgi:hypothetical protein
VQVRIATELWDEKRQESQHIVKLEILTTYEPINRFSKDLKALVLGRIKEAVLESDFL